MGGQLESWRVDLHDKEIKRLRDRLYEAEEKIRELERRPLEWLLKAELAVLYLFALGMWVFTIVEITAKG